MEEPERYLKKKKKKSNRTEPNRPDPAITFWRVLPPAAAAAAIAENPVFKRDNGFTALFFGQ